MILQLRLSNSGFRPAMYPSSVVQTGVKSFGWENRIAHPLPIQSWKLIFPWVVSAVKFGASLLIRNAMLHSSVSTGCLPPGVVNRRPILYAAARPSATPDGLTSLGPVAIVIPAVAPLTHQLLESILTLTQKRRDDAPFPIDNVRASRA